MQLQLHPAMKVVTIEWHVDASAPKETVVDLRFRPVSDSQQLAGSPAKFFNEPTKGAELVATVPELETRGVDSLELEVNTGAQGPVRVRVKIKRPSA